MDVKEAISAAKSYLQELYADERIRDIGLEEVSQNHSGWLITLGFVRDDDKYFNNFSAVLAEIANRRVYKIFSIDNETGRVTSMKNRD